VPTVRAPGCHVAVLDHGSATAQLIDADPLRTTLTTVIGDFSAAGPGKARCLLATRRAVGNVGRCTSDVGRGGLVSRPDVQAAALRHRHARARGPVGR
jgi:hypothetical protein